MGKRQGGGAVPLDRAAVGILADHGGGRGGEVVVLHVGPRGDGVGRVGDAVEDLAFGVEDQKLVHALVKNAVVERVQVAHSTLDAIHADGVFRHPLHLGGLGVNAGKSQFSLEQRAVKIVVLRLQHVQGVDAVLDGMVHRVGPRFEVGRTKHRWQRGVGHHGTRGGVPRFQFSTPKHEIPVAQGVHVAVAAAKRGAEVRAITHGLHSPGRRVDGNQLHVGAPAVPMGQPVERVVGPVVGEVGRGHVGVQGVVDVDGAQEFTSHSVQRHKAVGVGQDVEKPLAKAVQVGHAGRVTIRGRSVGAHHGVGAC